MGWIIITFVTIGSVRTDMKFSEEKKKSITRIPLKNIFDAAPVSRSQAKKICNRLEKFQEVELDFEDLDWMGQGFAHQIFVVFEKTNPQIKIVPINMSEAVAKMYNHVINS